MFVNVLLFDELCHWIVPLLPVSVSIVLFVPVHTVSAPDMLPATDIGFTVTIALDEVAAEQTPLVATTL
jgi:hypothetical protein